MGKGMPPRTAALAIAALLLFLCLGWTVHQGHGVASAARTEHAGAEAGRGDAGSGNNDAIAPADAGRAAATAPHAAVAETLEAIALREARATAESKTGCRGARSEALSRVYASHSRPADAGEAIDAALLLSQLRRHAEASSLLLSASDRWPRDLELARLAWSKCDAKTCDRAARLERMLALDPDNAVSWMHAAEDAMGRRDDRAIDAALDRAARASGYDTHDGVLFLHGMALARQMSLPDGCVASMRRMLEAQLRHPATAEDVAIWEAESMENQVLPPGYAVAAACRPSAAPPASPRRAACLALLPRMAAADTLLERDVGVKEAIDLLPDLPRDAPLRETYRRQEWLKEQLPRLSYDPAFFARKHADGDWASLVAMATAQHLWPPPAGWLPGAPVSRARVLGEPTPERR